MGANHFIKVTEVVAIHTERYNRLIARLLATEDYPKETMLSGAISRFDYYKAKERKVKAYLDSIQTMVQKEKLLQFHTSGFELQVIDEKVEVIKTKQGFDAEKLTFEEQLELYEYMKKAKKQNNFIAPITTIQSSEVKSITVNGIKVDQQPNITLIKQEKPADALLFPSMKVTDPTSKLKESLMKLAAKKFKEVGGNLTDEEEKLIEVVK